MQLSPDMEDLMRKAAEAYPLKEMDDRWEDIASKIGAAPLPLPPAKKQAGYRRYFILLLLLMLFLFTGDFLINRNSRQIINSNNRSGYAVKATEVKQKKQSPLPLTKRSNVVLREEVTGSNASHFTRSMPFHKTPVLHASDFKEDRKDKTDNQLTEEESFNVSTETFRTTHREILMDKTIYLQPNIFPFEWRNQPFFLSPDVKQKAARHSLRKKFYFGITGGPSFNSVNEQNLGPGWNLGLIGGYYAGNRLSLETGIVLSQKNYWTSGAYFSMEKIGASMPPPTKIMEVDGSSKVIEIPLHIRYHFFQNRKRSVFSSAGFSSYLLAKEYNQYHTSTNGTMQMMYGTYKKNEQYFAASLDLGIGYEQNLGRDKSIRFQPYIQIPVKGIGMGNLQIMSTGLRIALTKRAN